MNEWTKKIRKEGYNIDRQINGIKREELKVWFPIKKKSVCTPFTVVYQGHPFFNTRSFE